MKHTLENSYPITMVSIYFLFLISILGCYCTNDENPVVETPLGTVRGYHRTSPSGKIFAAFEGIPFAKPPIGEKRFEAPEPIDPWEDIWEANLPTTCSQYGDVPPYQINGVEDCLHINVYVPRENPNPEEKLEVVIHIHGGSFLYGSGAGYSQPGYIIDKEVIFVTFNYRLGILGFLSTEDEIVPGNNGMKDQVMALKWVQENIASFGGNPDSVTLTGLSAGSCSVHLHYFSEMSKGLFHRGFSQSGVALNPFAIQNGALKKARLLAEAVDCPTSSSKDLVDCLKRQTFEALLEKMPTFFAFGVLPMSPFAPVVEKGSEPFLKADPYYLLMNGEVTDVPWMASNTKDEGYVPMIVSPDDLDELGKNWKSLASAVLDFDYTLDETLWANTSDKIRDFYFGEDEFDSTSLDDFVSMMGDRIFYVDAESAVRLQAETTNSSVYYYRFTYLGDDNETNLLGHAQDGKYFYYGTGEDRPESELKMIDFVLDMLVSYAKTGIPTIEGVEWRPTEFEQLTYLNLSSFTSTELSVETVEELTPREFWESLGFAENGNLQLIQDT